VEKRAPSAREAAALRQQLGDSERDGPVGPCPSNLTRKARRVLARFRQDNKKNRLMAVSFIVLAEAVRDSSNPSFSVIVALTR
jgi:hypothetical protein